VKVTVKGRTLEVSLMAKLTSGDLLVVCGRAGCGVELARIDEHPAQHAHKDDPPTIEREVWLRVGWDPDDDGILRRTHRVDRYLPEPRRPIRSGRFDLILSGPEFDRSPALPVFVACPNCGKLNALLAQELRIGTFPVQER